MTTQSAIQRSLPLEISARTVLVTLEAVRIARGCDAESVLNCVGDATHPKFLRWVFNVGVKPDGDIRELRFWKDELLGAVGVRWSPEKEIISKILGNRRTFPRGEIEVQWTINSTTITRLVRAGEFTEVNHELTRASLAAFLERRLQ
ncbi:MAG: hypothetical protein ABSF60_14205 [Verrucomicrobiota bacterium]|jgi:hypothetical protein